MHEYDTALKTVLMRLTSGVLRLLTGGEDIVRWHNVELPEVSIPRVDLLGETAEGGLVHIELQSSNDPDMALRMLEYALSIRRALGRFPSQVVLYAGQPPLRMKSQIEETDLTFGFRVFDIRQMDGEALLASPQLEDNVIAVLTRFADERVPVRRILRRIARSEPEKRGLALAELAILAGLRNLGTILIQETSSMPILNDIMDHDLFGPKIREGIAIGIEQGERKLVLRQIEKRFGPLPGWAKSRLEAMPLSAIDGVGLRLLDVSTLEQLLA